jgi:hypothetical protein
VGKAKRAHVFLPARNAWARRNGAFAHHTRLLKSLAERNDAAEGVAISMVSRI